MAKSGAAIVELDLFRTEKEPTTKKLLDRGRSFRDIQHAVSKMNLDVVKSVIARSSSPSAPSSPKEDQLQICRANSSCEKKNESNSGPLTIFYNGTVMVFDASPEKAENILKLAKDSNKSVTASESNDSKMTGGSIDQRPFFATLSSGDMPIARRKSLGRFLEKRRERMTFACPYANPSSITNSMMSAGHNNNA